ncbi:hypothetical protein TSOC_011106, partial [Tetrabaena socialis]
ARWACGLRLVNKAVAAQFRGPQHTTVRLSQPVPHFAFAQHAGSEAMRRLTLRQRRVQLPCLTARSGSIPNLEWLFARGDDFMAPPPVEVLEAAAAAGQMEVCRWLREQGCTPTKGVLVAAAGSGQQAVCEWLLADGCLDDYYCETVAAAAARGGHVGLMDWLLLHIADEPDVFHLLQSAAEGCDLPTLQRLHRDHLDSNGGELPAGFYNGGPYNYIEHFSSTVFSRGVASPTADWQEKLVWLEGRQSVVTCDGALERADWRSRLEWLQQRGYPLNVHTAAHEAVQLGNVDALQYLLAEGAAVPSGPRHPASAADPRPPWLLSRDLMTLKVLHEYAGNVGMLNALIAAASQGCLATVTWLVGVLGADNVLFPELLVAAARSGCFELLAWLHEHGCECNESVFTAAADAGCEEQIEWLAERGYPMEEDGQPFTQAVLSSDLATLSCLQRLGCRMSQEEAAFTSAVEYCALRDIKELGGLRWMLEQGCPVDWTAVEQAAQSIGSHMGDSGRPNTVLRAWVKEQRAQRE